MAAQQQEINWNRGKQLRMLREIEIPTVRWSERTSSSGALIKSVLRQLDDYGGGRSCWPGLDTVARDLGRGERTVRMACAALELLGLIHRQRKLCPDGKTRLHFVIFWDQVEFCWARRAEQPASVAGYQTATDADQTATDARRSISRKRIGNDQEAPPPPPSSESVPERDAWEAAEERLFSCGLARAAITIRCAKQAGLSPADALALAAVFERDREAYQGAGALHFAVTHYRPGHSPEDARFWPPRSRQELPF